MGIEPALFLEAGFEKRSCVPSHIDLSWVLKMLSLVGSQWWFFVSSAQLRIMPVCAIIYLKDGL